MTTLLHGAVPVRPPLTAESGGKANNDLEQAQFPIGRALRQGWPHSVLGTQAASAMSSDQGLGGVATVMVVLLEQPGREETASEISRRAGLAVNTVRTILNDLIARRWADRRVSVGEGGQPHQCFWLTDKGIVGARDQLRREWGDNPALKLLRSSLPPARGSQPVTITPHMQLVLLLLLQPDDYRWFANAIARRLGLDERGVSKILTRLTRAGWLMREIEGDHDGHWFPRFIVRLTDAGADRARAELNTSLTAADIDLATSLRLSLTVLQPRANHDVTQALGRAGPGRY